MDSGRKSAGGGLWLGGGGRKGKWRKGLVQAVFRSSPGESQSSQTAR